MSPQPFTYNEPAKALTANAFSKNGYNFIGWDTNEAGTNVVYTDQQELQNLTSVNNGVFNLYAVWEVITHDVTINTTEGISTNPTVLTGLAENSYLVITFERYLDALVLFTVNGANQKNSIDLETKKFTLQIVEDYTIVIEWLPTIAEVREQSTGEVTFVGVVSRILGDNIAVADETGAINLYQATGTVALGDMIKVIGTRSVDNGLEQIINGTMTVLSSGNTAPVFDITTFMGIYRRQTQHINASNITPISLSEDNRELTVRLNTYDAVIRSNESTGDVFNKVKNAISAKEIQLIDVYIDWISNEPRLLIENVDQMVITEFANDAEKATLILDNLEAKHSGVTYIMGDGSPFVANDPKYGIPINWNYGLEDMITAENTLKEVTVTTLVEVSATVTCGTVTDTRTFNIVIRYVEPTEYAELVLTASKIKNINELEYINFTYFDSITSPGIWSGSAKLQNETQIGSAPDHTIGFKVRYVPNTVRYIHAIEIVVNTDGEKPRTIKINDFTVMSGITAAAGTISSGKIYLTGQPNSITLVPSDTVNYESIKVYVKRVSKLNRAYEDITAANISFDSEYSTPTTLSLIEKGPIYGKKAVWSSDNTDVISNDGVITLPEITTTVKLTVLIKYFVIEQHSATYDIKVIGIGSRLETQLATIPALPTETENDISSYLLATTEDGTNITWTSSDADVITNAGVVNRPFDGNANVTMTATVTEGGYIRTREFIVTVLAQPVTVTFSLTAPENTPANGDIYMIGVFPGLEPTDPTPENNTTANAWYNFTDTYKMVRQADNTYKLDIVVPVGNYGEQGFELEYKYVLVLPDNTKIWEADPNRTHLASATATKAETLNEWPNLRTITFQVNLPAMPDGAVPYIIGDLPGLVQADPVSEPYHKWNNYTDQYKLIYDEDLSKYVVKVHGLDNYDMYYKFVYVLDGDVAWEDRVANRHYKINGTWTTDVTDVTWPVYTPTVTGDDVTTNPTNLTNLPKYTSLVITFNNDLDLLKTFTVDGDSHIGDINAVDKTYTLKVTDNHAIVVEWITIADVRAQTSGEVTFVGIVTRMAGDNVAVADNTGAINLYKGTKPAELAVGDKVKVAGTRGDYNGLEQITSGTVTIISNDNPRPTFDITTLEGINARQSQHINISGLTPVSLDGQNLTVSLNGQTIVVRANSNTGAVFEAVQEAYLAKSIELVGVYVDWFSNNAQFLIEDASQIILTPYTDEEKVAKIATYLVEQYDTAEYDTGSDVELITTHPIYGGTITWAYVPTGAVINGKWVALESKNTSVVATASIDVNGKTGTQAVNVTVIYVAPGTTTEELLYETGFESDEGFSGSTNYKAGMTANGWAVANGTVTATAGSTSDMHIQMRLYSTGTISATYNNETAVSNITKVVFNAFRSDGGSSLTVQFSLDGSTWSTGELVTLEASDAQYEVVSDLVDATYVRWTTTDANPSQDNKRYNLDDVKIYGMVSLNPAEKDLSMIEFNPTEYDTATNLDLYTVGKLYGSTIGWTSSHPEVISTTGEMVLPTSTTDVTLTANASHTDGTYIASKEFIIRVIGTGGGAVGATYIETFDTSTAGGSYGNGTFTGVGSIVWTYVASRNEDIYGIEGAGIMLRRNTEPSSLSATFNDGITEFSFNYRKAYTGATIRKYKVDVTHNGVTTTYALPDFGGGSGADSTIHTFTQALNLTGTVTIKIYADSNAQATFDNFTWTTNPS